MMPTTRRIDQIIVGERARSELTKIDELAQSIKEQGLLSPIAIDQDDNLIAGERRLAACQQLGWTEIDVHVLESQGDAAWALRAERDENTQRVPMTKADMARLARRIAAIEAPVVKERIMGGTWIVTDSKPPAGTGGKPTNPENSPRTGKGGVTDKVIAQALGIGTTQARELQLIGERGTEEDLASLDRGESSEKVAKKIRQREKTAPALPPGRKRLTDARSAKHLMIETMDQRNILKDADGKAVALATLAHKIVDLRPGGLNKDVPEDEVRQWMADFAEARRELNQLIKILRKDPEQP